MTILEHLKETIFYIAPNASDYYNSASEIIRDEQRGYITALEAQTLIEGLIEKACKTARYNQEHAGDHEWELHYYDPQTGKIKFHRAA